MENLLNLIPTELIIVVAGLACINVALTKAVIVNDKYSPIIIMAIGIIFCVAKEGFSVDNVMLGVIAAAIAIAGNAAYKHRGKLVKKE